MVGVIVAVRLGTAVVVCVAVGDAVAVVVCVGVIVWVEVAVVVGVTVGLEVGWLGRGRGVGEVSGVGVKVTPVGVSVTMGGGVPVNRRFELPPERNKTSPKPTQ